MDDVLIVNGLVAQVWRGQRKEWAPDIVEGVIVAVSSDLNIAPGMSYDAEGDVFSAPDGLGVDVEDVRNEASRRMQVLVGARDEEHLAIKISNASRKGIELQNIRLGGALGLDGQPVAGRDWNTEEAALAAYLISSNAALDLIREKSNDIEKMSPIPDDYATNDAYWS